MEIKLNETHSFRTVNNILSISLKRLFRFRSMIRNMEAITVMKHPSQSMSEADFIRTESVLFIYLSVAYMCNIIAKLFMGALQIF